MHDASHNAISARRWPNVLLAYAGVAYTSPHEWTLQHVVAHHARPNGAGEDPDFVHVNRYAKPFTGCKALDAALVWLVALPLGVTVLAPVRVFLSGTYPHSSASERRPSCGGARTSERE